jgi:hypothetical protein
MGKRVTPKEFDAILAKAIDQAVAIMNESDTKIANLIQVTHDEVCVLPITNHINCVRAFGSAVLDLIRNEYLRNEYLRVDSELKKVT